jgi:hypothetical protein
MMKRHLAQTAAVEPEREITFPSLIRTASESGLLRSGWDVWYEFRKASNLTSHVYNEEAARQVVEHIPAFAEEADYLYRELERTVTAGGD